MKEPTISNREITKQIKQALNDKYSFPEWIFLTEVPNATGSMHRRSMDGFAYNLYPSKNYQKIIKKSLSKLKH